MTADLEKKRKNKERWRYIDRQKHEMRIKHRKSRSSSIRHFIPMIFFVIVTRKIGSFIYIYIFFL